MVTHIYNVKLQRQLIVDCMAITVFCLSHYSCSTSTFVNVVGFAGMRVIKFRWLSIRTTGKISLRCFGNTGVSPYVD